MIYLKLLCSSHYLCVAESLSDSVTKSKLSMCILRQKTESKQKLTYKALIGKYLQQAEGKNFVIFFFFLLK